MPKRRGEGEVIVGVGVGTEYMTVEGGKFHIKPIRRLPIQETSRKIQSSEQAARIPVDLLTRISCFLPMFCTCL